MNTQVETLEHNKVKVTVSVDADAVKKAIEQAFDRSKKNFNVPGFRKGKVSRQVIEKMYGKTVFYNDAADIIINNTIYKAIQDNEIKIAAPIQEKALEVTAMNEEGMTYTAEIIVEPEVELGDYKNLEVEVEKVEVTDEDVEKALNDEAAKNSREITVTDRAVADKDKVTIDFVGSIDGVEFEGGKGEDYDLVIGSHSFIDGFEDQLIGKNVGDDVDVNVTFPATYHVTDLADKPALFKVKVKAIKVNELPEINDAFAADVSEFETLAEYKEDIKAKLLEEKEKNKENIMNQQAVENAVENATIDLPQEMVDVEVERKVKEFEQRMKQSGINLQQYLQFTGQDYDQFTQNFAEASEKEVRTRLVLKKIAEVENIEVTDAEVDEEVANIAKMYGMEADELKKNVGPYELATLKEELKYNKAAKVIFESAKPVEK